MCSSDLTSAPLGKATSPEEQERQAEALAGLKGSIISAWVSTQYPDAELYADVAIYTGSGPERPRPLEVFAYDENGAELSPIRPRIRRTINDNAR